MVNFMYGERCDEPKQVSAIETYFTKQFDFVFTYINYSHVLATVLTVRT